MKCSATWVIVVAVVAALLAFGVHSSFAAEEAPTKEAEGAEAKPAGPSSWADSKVLWASLTMLFATFATSWAQSRIGMAGAGALAEKPDLAGTYIILIAIPETMVILGFVVSSMIIMMK